MGLDKPITKCGNCERGEPRESNFSRLYVEMGCDAVRRTALGNSDSGNVFVSDAGRFRRLLEAVPRQLGRAP
jgi:hypothetical protein